MVAPSQADGSRDKDTLPFLPGRDVGRAGQARAGPLPPAQVPPGQLHLGQAVVAQHLYPGDVRQWPVAVREL